eukprot:gene5409-6748_t
MPIGNKNENDGSTLNEFSGLTISDKKNQSSNTQSTSSSTPEPYIPPSRRKQTSSQSPSDNYNNNNKSNNNNYYNKWSDSPKETSNYERENNNNNNNSGRDSRDNYSSRDVRDSRDEENFKQQNNPRRDREDFRKDNNQREEFRKDRDDYRNSPREDYQRRDSPSSYNNRGPSSYNNRGGNDRWDNNNGGYSSRDNRGGYSSSYSYNNYPSAFGGSRSSYNKGGSRSDRFYDRWLQYKDSRHHPEMKREELVLNEDEAEEIFKAKSNHGLDFDAYDDDDISIETSEHICAPLNSFGDVDLGDVLIRNIKYAKYTKPTPVQRSTLPIVLKGRDLMACAQTGSGKTAAFLFPIISGILLTGAPEPAAPYRPGIPRPAQPRALVLAPTRELAQQIYDEAQKFSYGSPVTSVVVYGGSEISQQISELDKGVDILVATTGRLVDLLSRGRVSLSKVKYLILDEADRMLDMGFEPQIRQIIKDHDLPHLKDRQTLMFSATFPKPIQQLAAEFLNNFVFLKVGVIGTTQNITQRIEYVVEEEKTSYLLDFLTNLKSDGLTLIFVETKRLCDSLTNYLYQKNFPTTCIHGDLSQSEREMALASFRSGQTPYLVATDVASRGLHIPNVMYVINFDLPNEVVTYVHRIGRTGRAGKKGFAISFFNEKNKPVANDILKLMKQSNQEIPDWFEKMVYSLSRSNNKGPPPKSSYNNPFSNKGSYNNHGGGYNNYNRGGGDRDNYGGGGGRDNYSNNNSRNERRNNNDDYSMHHQYFNNGGSYN